MHLEVAAVAPQRSPFQHVPNARAASRLATRTDLVCYSPCSADRQRVEAFVRAEFRAHFNARVQHFMPLLLALHEAAGEPRAVVGAQRTRSCGPLARHGLASLRRSELLRLRRQTRARSSRNCDRIENRLVCGGTREPKRAAASIATRPAGNRSADRAYTGSTTCDRISRSRRTRQARPSIRNSLFPLVM